MTSLVEALPAEIIRVGKIKEIYIGMRRMPGVNVEPAILAMTASIEAAIRVSAGGDVVEMLRAFEDLKGFEL